MPPRKPSPVGAQLRVGGGLATTGLAYASEVGAEAAQVFLSNPRAWATAPGDPGQDELFRMRCATARMPVFVHAPYLVNLGSPDQLVCERSAVVLEQTLRRAVQVGARGVVLHAGSAVDGAHHEQALRRSRESLLPLLEQAGRDDVLLLVEPTAGGGHPLAADLAQLAGYLDRMDRHPGLGVCLDTCHLFAAGHDLAVAGGMRSTLNLVSRLVGSDRLRLVHANDSRDGCGSRRDRHANIGQGQIGIEPFAELFHHPVTRGVPVVVETPGNAPGHAKDIALLKSLRDR